MTVDTCCPANVEQDSELDELWDDPTLADCCRRDIAEMRRRETVTTALQQADRINSRLQLQQAMFAKLEGENTILSDEDSLGDDSDTELEWLRDLRMQQLKVQAQQHQDSRAGGFGQLTTLHARDLLSEVEERADHCCVCHLLVEGYEPGQQLDEHLEVLAHRYRGTFFARVPAARHSELVKRLKLLEVPALVCFKEGSVVGKAPLTQFGAPVGVLEEEVDKYLRRLGVMFENGDRSHGPDSFDEESNRQTGQDGETPCEVCGRCYPHEHVRAVYGATWDAEGSDSGGD